MGEIEIRVFGRVGLKGRMGEEVHQHAARVIDQIAKALRNENGVNIARRGLFELEQIVIGQRRLERNFNRGGRLVLIRNNADGHGAYGFTPERLFRIGAAGKDSEGAVELFGQHGASELVGVGHRAERDFLRDTFAQARRGNRRRRRRRI